MPNLFDVNNYVAYPESILEFSYNLKKIIDDYRARKINNTEFTEIVLYYAENNPEKLYDMEGYNITVQRKLGKTRMDILDNLLNSSQRIK